MTKRSFMSDGQRLFFQPVLLVRAATAAAAFLALQGAAAAQEVKPSFDCAKASSPAEKQICADPAMATADAAIARNYAAALKLLDVRARKALQQDQQWFVEYRNRIADFNQDIPKENQNFNLGEFMSDRATFLASVRKPESGFVGTWVNVSGDVKIKDSGKGKLEISADTGNPATAGSVCDIGGTVKNGPELRLVDTDDDDKPTGFSFRFKRDGDQLIVTQSGHGKEGRDEPPSCGAGGQVDGAFFLTEAKPSAKDSAQ